MFFDITNISCVLHGVVLRIPRGVSGVLRGVSGVLRGASVMSYKGATRCFNDVLQWCFKGCPKCFSGVLWIPRGVSGGFAVYQWCLTLVFQG